MGQDGGFERGIRRVSRRGRCLGEELHRELGVPFLMPLSKRVEKDRLLDAFAANAGASETEMQAVPPDLSDLRARDDVRLHGQREVDREVESRRERFGLLASTRASGWRGVARRARSPSAFSALLLQPDRDAMDMGTVGLESDPFLGWRLESLPGDFDDRTRIPSPDVLQLFGVPLQMAIGIGPKDRMVEVELRIEIAVQERAVHEHAESPSDVPSFGRAPDRRDQVPVLVGPVGKDPESREALDVDRALLLLPDQTLEAVLKADREARVLSQLGNVERDVLDLALGESLLADPRRRRPDRSCSHSSRRRARARAGGRRGYRRGASEPHRKAQDPCERGGSAESRERPAHRTPGGDRRDSQGLHPRRRAGS